MNTTIDTILQAGLGGGVLCILQLIQYYWHVQGWGIVHTIIDAILQACPRVGYCAYCNRYNTMGVSRGGVLCILK